MKNNKAFVLMDDDARWCIIVGTDDRKVAETALRETENEWYGENHLEEPIPFDDFGSVIIYYGKPKGESEEVYYWGEKDPKEYFEGSYETEQGFIAGLD